MLQCFFFRWFFGPVLSSWFDPSPLTYQHRLRVPPQANRDGCEIQAPFPQALLFDEETWNQPENHVYLSCVVPSYNEESRVQVMMDEAMEYLLTRAKSDPTFTFEMVFVDDGSKDRTAAMVQGFVTQYGPSRIRLLKLAANQGKGGAVQQGMLHARGELLLMVDADGASKFSDVAKLERDLLRIRVGGHGIAVGSRRHLQQDAVATRAWHRNLMMYVFHFLVATLTGIGHIKDTQCGFKLFTRSTGQFLFVNQHLRRWCFDVELLYLSMRSGSPIPVVEVPITWDEIPGSKINLIESSFVMTRDMILIRLAYTTGIWKNQPWKKIVQEKLHREEAETNQLINKQDKYRSKAAASTSNKK